MYIEIWNLWKTYSFLFFWFLIKKSTGLAGSRWPLLIRIPTPLKINLFPLIYINLRVNYFYRINEITWCLFCREISSIYSKRFWGNLRIIPRIYKCEAFAEPFKFINQLWIFNKLFITVSINLLNTEKLSSYAQIIFLIGTIFKHGITQGDTRNGFPIVVWSCVGSYVERRIFFFCEHSYRKKIENIVNHIIKFVRSLTDFVIGYHINTPNELNYVWKSF